MTRPNLNQMIHLLFDLFSIKFFQEIVISSLRQIFSKTRQTIKDPPGHPTMKVIALMLLKLATQAILCTLYLQA